MLGLGTVTRKLFGSANDRKVSAARKDAERINALEDEIQALSDEALRGKTAEFRERLEGGETLDRLLPEAFAVVREGAKRALGMRPFDVQLIGGRVLHDGKVAEMKTGEGKTLVATMPVYLNALPGRGVHVVTVNDYLARRDAEWMGKLYTFLGLTVGVVVPGMEEDARRAAYACDITYATNNELGFDYLRDNMKMKVEDMVQRGHAYAIVDEVDSILIDEARTPLIISGPTEDQTDLYIAIDKIIPGLPDDAFELDEKQRTVTLTEEGNEAVEKALQASGHMTEEQSLYDPTSVSFVHHVQQALRAHKLFLRDRDYIVKNNKVIIIDEFTGRMMEGRRWGDGMHQAVEAKEGVKIQPENVTMASVTFQNYFRLYDKLAGMTGTAMTEAEELMQIYGLEVVEVPTNLPIARVDDDDQVFRTGEEKFGAIVEAIRDGQSRGQPILVGTTSIEKSELLASRLEALGIPHQVLNARFHEQEAQIVAQAGVPGAVTIATNMAGRGTDIQLGGNLAMRLANETPEDATEGDRQALERKLLDEIAEKKRQALDAGGLWVIGTERHESRRIDNQLRGRSGRQGDPGRSSFFLSLQDDLLRIFGSERIDTMLQRLGLEEGEAIVHTWVNKSIEKAQGKVEARNFDIRKNLLKFDDVMNDQRKVIFEQRREFMDEEDLSLTIIDMRRSVLEDMIERHVPEKAYHDQWDLDALEAEIGELMVKPIPIRAWAEEEGVDQEALQERVIEATDEIMARKEIDFGEDIFRQIERQLLLQLLDKGWREHLQMLDHLRSAVGLRGYGQRDPLNEYKTEAFQLFDALLTQLRYDVTKFMFDIRPKTPEEIEAEQRMMEEQRRQLERIMAQQQAQAALGREAMAGAAAAGSAGLGAQPSRPALGADAGVQELDPRDPETWRGVGRNAPCPCGSGKKYKHCHGRAG